MLDRLREEVDVGSDQFDQFGGVRDMGTDHMLVEMTADIMECLEDQRAAVSVVSIDLSKAYNRISNGQCLRALAEKGASTESIKLVASFLHQREMIIKING